MNKDYNRFFSTYPTNQNALDIFKGEWSSIMPTGDEKYVAGNIPLFEDQRTAWAISELGGVKDKTVLELGPLEGGHTYMLEKSDAKSILAIEANSRSFLKCLITKELFGLKKSKILCGNFLEYLKTPHEKFDVCFATGVLYHLIDPIEFIHDLSITSDNIFMWTHYFDENIISLNKDLVHRFSGSQSNEIRGFRHTLNRYEYQNALDWDGYSGGINTFSNWLSKKDIIDCLNYFGYKNIKINFEDPNHPHGPALALVSKKE